MLIKSDNTGDLKFISVGNGKNMLIKLAGNNFFFLTQVVIDRMNM